MSAKGNKILSVYAKLEIQDCLIYDDVLSLCFLFACFLITRIKHNFSNHRMHNSSEVWYASLILLISDQLQHQNFSFQPAVRKSNRSNG